MEAAIIRRTQDSLGKVIRKPPLTEKLLGKPPFRYLHDILTEVIRATGFFKGLYTESELKSDNVKDKEAKIGFLQKAIDVVVLVTGDPLSVKPARIVAGHEPEKTNEFLQAIGKCCLNKLSSDDAVKRVLSGEKSELKGKPPSSSKSQDKENRESKDEDRRSHKDKEDRRETEIRERSGSRDRKERQQLKDEERKPPDRERKKERDRVRETERDGLREGEKNDREKPGVRESGPEADKERSKEKSERERARDRERRSEGGHGRDKERRRDKERDRDREQEKERKSEKDPEDRSRERGRERGERTRDREDKSRTREQNKERKRDSERERKRERTKDHEHQGGREELLQGEERSERKQKTLEESMKKSSDIPTRESEPDKEQLPSRAARPSASKLRERRPAKPSEEGLKDPVEADDVSGSPRVRVPGAQGPMNPVQFDGFSRRTVQHLVKDLGHDIRLPVDRINLLIGTLRQLPIKAQHLFKGFPTWGMLKVLLKPPFEPLFSVGYYINKAGESASDDEAAATDIHNSNVQPNVSAQRKIPRPGSARPAPPRVKRQPSAEVVLPERISSGKGLPSVIVDKQKQDSDDDDNEFVVEEAAPQVSDMPAMEMEPELDFAADDKHGSLVKKILETKKDYDTQPENATKDKTILSDNGRKKEKDIVTKEIEKLRSSIQILCRSALPLGKIMDYIQEDMDTMQNELLMWRKENSEHSEVLKREQSITDSAVEPLKTELADLEQLIKEQRDKICTVKGNILRNEEKLQKMVQTVSGSNRD
ncbi:TRAF3-interacting protein 1 [Gastrophryne carolinensis]